MSQHEPCHDDLSSVDPTSVSIDVFSHHVALIDATGLIIEVNAVWRQWTTAHRGKPVTLLQKSNYLDECDRAADRGCFEAAKAATCIRSVINDHALIETMDYACHAPNGHGWFKLKVSRSPVHEPARFLIEHQRILLPELAENQIRLQLNMLASIEQAVVATDLTGAIVHWNPFAEGMYGWLSGEVLGKNIGAIIPGKYDEVLAELDFSRRSKSTSWSGELEVSHRSGRTMLVRLSNSIMRDERGHEIGVIGVSTDITELLTSRKALALSDLVYQAIGEAIIVVDVDANIIATNPAFCQLTSYSEAELVGHSTNLLRPKDVAFFFPDESRPMLERTGQWSGPIIVRTKRKRAVQVWMRVDINNDHPDSEKIRICTFSKITDQKRANETIWHQANFDILTELPNRNMFINRLGHEIKMAERDTKQIALLFIDLDQFKDVNDTLGHDVGDQLLELVAHRLKVTVRVIDMVARIGGDEFTVILSQFEDTNTIDRVASKIIKALAEPYVVSANTIYISASVGITIFPGDGGNVESLLKNADQAMYAAKNNGRNQFHYFTYRMQVEAHDRMQIIDDLREALAKHQFSLAYQPIVELTSGSIRKAEALLRWYHPLRGMIEPSVFIPIAEQTGMISAIGEWVIHEASNQAEIWRKEIHPDFLVSVNISPIQLRKGGSDHISLSDHCRVGNGLSNGHRSPIILEITEGVLLETSNAVVQQLQSLRDAGIELAIDDFGTGYSALSYLRKFRVDYLKIDRMFISKLDESPIDFAMCEAIIVMAHKLGIFVIAEGIETSGQRDLLESAGCDYGQGYLFSRPLSSEQLDGLLRGVA